jgi:hypothetical protein
MLSSILENHCNPPSINITLATCLLGSVSIRWCYLSCHSRSLSDFYEIDKLPNLQSPTVIQTTQKHFSRYGVPHTLITDNGTQFTSELFAQFASKYKFHHITSSPYWSQSSGRAEAAVKSAKHILLTADDVDLAILSVRNTAPA